MIITGTRLVGGTYTAVPTAQINPVLALDAATYVGSGNWIDSVASREFQFPNGVTYSAGIAGGSFNFSPAASQWAYCSGSLSDLATWTVEVWHYYDGTNDGAYGGQGACLVTETFPGSTYQINYSLGNDLGGTGTGGNLDLYSGFFDGGWRTTASGTILTPGNWYYIVGTYDGVNNKLYVNNSLISSVPYAAAPISSQGGIRLMVRWDNPDYWGGRLAIVNIYDQALGTAQIAQTWTDTKSRFGL